MPSASDLGDVQRQCPHPVDVRDHLDGAHNRPKVAGDGRLQGKQDESALFGLSTHLGDLLVVGDDLLGEHQIGLQKCLCCALHGNTGQPTHLSELFGELRELLVIRSTHIASVRSQFRVRHEPA